MPADLPLPPNGYDDFLRALKDRIRTAQVRPALSVNRELVLLYWQIGRDIIVRQAEQGWGQWQILSLPERLPPTDKNLFNSFSVSLIRP